MVTATRAQQKRDMIGMMCMIGMINFVRVHVFNPKGLNTCTLTYPVI